MNFERDYHWGSDGPSCANAYLLPALERLLDAQFSRAPLRILDLGCGNGAVTAGLASQGHQVLGVDASAAGIAIARRAHPQLQFEEGSIYDDGLASVVGPGFDCVVSLEVIEHLHMPRRLMAVSRAALKPDGILIVSTPYHGYLKNLALSVLNRWDKHFSVWWDGGHVKFFSARTLSDLLSEEGFTPMTVIGVGRMPGLWKSLLVVSRKRDGA